LTRILQDSLGGTSALLLIANIAPEQSQLVDTLKTLSFASKSKAVVNRVKPEIGKLYLSLILYIFTIEMEITVKTSIVGRRERTLLRYFCNSCTFAHITVKIYTNVLD
jgi:hypothetical protein